MSHHADWTFVFLLKGIQGDKTTSLRDGSGYVSIEEWEEHVASRERRRRELWNAITHRTIEFGKRLSEIESDLAAIQSEAARIASDQATANKNLATINEEFGK